MLSTVRSATRQYGGRQTKRPQDWANVCLHRLLTLAGCVTSLGLSSCLTSLGLSFLLFLGPRPLQVLLKVITPYTRISISFIASELNIPAEEVEALLVALILDGHIDGHIDQIAQLLLLRQTSADSKKYAAAEKWATQLAQLQGTVLTKLA